MGLCKQKGILGVQKPFSGFDGIDLQYCAAREKYKGRPTHLEKTVRCVFYENVRLWNGSERRPWMWSTE